jgi:hypothetical protein
VGSEKRSNEQRPDPRIAGPKPDEKSSAEGKREREQPEADGSVTRTVELRQVDFHPGEEHQQELAKFGEKVNDLTVPGGELKSERADQNPGRNQADHGRKPDATTERRDREQDQHRDGEPRQWWWLGQFREVGEHGFNGLVLGIPRILATLIESVGDRHFKQLPLEPSSTPRVFNEELLRLGTWESSKL